MPSLCLGGYGFDSITPPAGYAGQLADAELVGFQGTWMRVRGLVEREQGAGNGESGARTVETDRAGLRALRARGIKTAVFLRWEPSSWVEGVRAGGGHRLPLNLREAYERGRRLGATYGDLVDVWEIENEPDIDFVAENPETFTAFQKALYLGLKSGASASAVSLSHKVKLKALPAESTWLAQKRGWSDLPFKRSSSTQNRAGRAAHVIAHKCAPTSGAGGATPRVIMAPLALPPGPYLERLWANGIASYTDGFNFHYYGYAEDFSGVYEQFRDAVGELSAGSLEPGAVSSDWVGRKRGLKLKADGSKLIARKPLPVFITEYGYGLLDAEARDTVEGRVRQWRWFASVVAQVRALRPEGPMAFLTEPYYEANLNEFGLTMAAQPEFRSSLSHKIKFKEELGEKAAAVAEAMTRPVGEPHAVVVEVATDTVAATHEGVLRTSSPASELLHFEPGDFGAKRAEPWMERIGHGLGENHASPALAYLWDFAERNPYRPRDWRVTTAPASPVVIDLVAGLGMEQIKSAGGYVVSSHVDVGNYVLSGSAKWVLYNFSEKPITGRFEIMGDGVASRVAACTITLAAGERSEIVDDLGVQAQVFAGRTLRAVFTPDNDRLAGAVWSTRLFPVTEWMVSKPAGDFEFPAGGADKNRALLAKRKTAEGEPVLHEHGRWRVTDGVRVEERDGVWRFHIDHLPAESMTSAVAELPLPEGFVFSAGMMLSLERRRTDVFADAPAPAQIKLKGEGEDRSAENPSLDLRLKPSTPAQMKSRAGRAGDMMSVSFRTGNGNLYQTWPRLRVADEWAEYAEQADNFTMGFFGRAALPWRFFDNRPASLVFVMRPSVLPAVFEVRGARIERVERGDVKRSE